MNNTPNAVRRQTPRTRDTEMIRYLSATGAMVYPQVSRCQRKLAMLLKLLETLAMGKLLGASDVSGHREPIRDGHHGHRVSARSGEALAHCLIRWLQVPKAGNDVMTNECAQVATGYARPAGAAGHRADYAAALDRADQSVERS